MLTCPQLQPARPGMKQGDHTLQSTLPLLGAVARPSVGWQSRILGVPQDLEVLLKGTEQECPLGFFTKP